MSASDDEEALFDDIYGSEEEEKKDSVSSKNESETKLESTETNLKDDKLNDKKDDESDDKSDNNKSQDIKDESISPSSNNDNSIPQSTTISNTQEPIIQSNISSNQQKVDLSRDAGKMFIGGLDWDTTEERMKEYFSKFGEVIDHTIMRESSTGRSRGFGFLTFASSSSVDEVVKTQHVLDGKVIDPKRAIPREEQDKTGKIFVGGIAPEVRPKEFEEFFSKFGTIIDAQLMLDKDTGRSRGFGFVTFDSPDAVDKVCQGRYLDFNGRQIEVKRAEPRGPQQQQNHIQQQQQRYMQQQGGYNNNSNNSNTGYGNSFPGAGLQNPTAPMGGQYYGGFTPETMTQYWQQMQQYWLQFQQQQQQGGSGSDMATNFQNFAAQQFQQQVNQNGESQSSPPPPPPSGGQDIQYDGNGGEGNDSYRRGGAPVNAPRGPRGGGRGGRGRGRGYGGGYHPYSRS